MLVAGDRVRPHPRYVELVVNDGGVAGWDGVVTASHADARSADKDNQVVVVDWGDGLPVTYWQCTNLKRVRDGG